MKKSLILTSVVLFALSAPAMAFHCPADVAKIQADGVVDDLLRGPRLGGILPHNLGLGISQLPCTPQERTGHFACEFLFSQSHSSCSLVIYVSQCVPV